mmetsp:Transcript_21327/g.69017  ORF Transcript_21327/g.69017 Transcript_21327/m.69017 type:complete len:217 (+) Transcript_21327:399-1049(+)
MALCTWYTEKMPGKRSVGNMVAAAPSSSASLPVTSMTMLSGSVPSASHTRRSAAVAADSHSTFLHMSSLRICASMCETEARRWRRRGTPSPFTLPVTLPAMLPAMLPATLPTIPGLLAARSSPKYMLLESRPGDSLESPIARSFSSLCTKTLSPWRTLTLTYSTRRRMQLYLDSSVTGCVPKGESVKPLWSLSLLSHRRSLSAFSMSVSAPPLAVS